MANKKQGPHGADKEGLTMQGEFRIPMIGSCYVYPQRRIYQFIFKENMLDPGIY
jgi:hypothetical protein